MKRSAILSIVLLFALVFAACDDGNEVGSGVDVNQTQNTADCAALGCPTTTTAPPQTTAPPATAAPVTTAKSVATTAKPTTTVAAPSIALTIGIFSDTSGKNQFEPRQGAIRAGQTVRFQNNDSQMRGVEDSGGAWKSPDIPAGGFWDFKPTAANTYNYNDTTRPYAVGQLVVR